MSSSTAAPAASSAGGSPNVDEKSLRRRARRRASLCPGAGWALLGYPGRGNLVLLCLAVWLASLAWLILTLSSASLWTAAVGAVAWLALWAAELFDIGWCLVRPAGESPLTRRFGFTTTVVWGVCLILAMLLFLAFRLIGVNDDSMAPAIEPGERLIFHRRVAEAELKPGTVIVYKLPRTAQSGTPGGLVVARILAAPDDELTIRKGRYVVNNEVTRYRTGGPNPNLKAPVQVPAYPRKLIVPPARYFVIQDSPETGADSQQLDYARRIDILSTRLFHFGSQGLMTPVK